MSRRWMPALALLATVAAGPVALAACGGGDNNGGTTSSGGAKSGTVALLLPENKTARYESADRPLFQQKLKQLCPDCKLIYSNAEQDAA
jgi:D-xylose transport system substrate-binding protein